jgi:hypothetical protein
MPHPKSVDMERQHTIWLFYVLTAYNVRGSLSLRTGAIDMTFEQAVADYVQQQNEYADRQYAEFFAGLSDELLAVGLANIEGDLEYLPYAPLTVNIRDREAGLRDEQRRFKAEIARRAAK